MNIKIAFYCCLEVLDLEIVFEKYDFKEICLTYISTDLLQKELSAVCFHTELVGTANISHQTLEHILCLQGLLRVMRRHMKISEFCLLISFSIMGTCYSIAPNGVSNCVINSIFP